MKTIFNNANTNNDKGNTMKMRAAASWALGIGLCAALFSPGFALAQTQNGEGGEQSAPADTPEAAKDAGADAKKAVPVALPVQPAPASVSAPAADAQTNEPRVHHAPISVAPPHQDLAIEVTLSFPQLIRSMALIYRHGTAELHAVSFQRGSGAGYVAVIPADDVIAPGVSYTIEIERTDGKRLAMFASRERMHFIQVIEDRMDARERILYERLGKRRSVASASGEFVQFGVVRGRNGVCPGGTDECFDEDRRVPESNEQYWKVELSYTYRPLRTVAEFSIRGGVVRGTSLNSNSLDSNDYKVGLNYGAPSVRFRILDEWHVEGEFLTSITEQGFAVGTGLMTIIGDPYGSNITLGFESIGFSGESYFGTRFFSRMDIAASDKLLISPIIEISDMPRSEYFGVRLLGEASYEIGSGFTAAVRAGYQAREAAGGGLGLGGRLSFAF